MKSCMGLLRGDLIVLLGDFSAHMDNDGDTWESLTGRNDLPDLNPSGVLFFDLWSVTLEHRCGPSGVGEAN